MISAHDSFQNKMLHVLKNTGALFSEKSRVHRFYNNLTSMNVFVEQSEANSISVRKEDHRHKRSIICFIIFLSFYFSEHLIMDRNSALCQVMYSFCAV